MNEEMRPASEGQPTPEEAPRTSGMAIASLVLGILSFTCITAPFAIILGIIALTQIKRNPNVRGAGMAWAGIIISIVVLVFGLILAAILFPVFDRARQTALRNNCLINLRGLSIAMNMYTDDYGAYPNDRWNDALRQYRPEDKDFSCPAVPGNEPSYGMNSRLLGISRNEIVSTAQTVLLFDSLPGANQVGGPELMPVPPRHRGNNVSFADGHLSSSPDDPATLNWNPETAVEAPTPPEIETESLDNIPE